MKTLILMRGVSGGGKSTKAAQLASSFEGAVIFSTDDFFMVDGVYNFNIDKLAENHAKNVTRTEIAMEIPLPVIIIDNTNLQFWQMKPYVELAQKHVYDVQFEEVHCDFETIMQRQAGRANIGKDLPITVVERMLKSFEPDATVEKVLASKKPF